MQCPGTTMTWLTAFLPIGLPPLQGLLVER